MEELLLGKDHSVATQQFLHASYIRRLLFAHKLNIYLTSVQETQLRARESSQRIPICSKNPEQRLFASLSFSSNYPVQDYFQCIANGAKEKP